jgi:hypothetical protein
MSKEKYEESFRESEARIRRQHWAKIPDALTVARAVREFAAR